MQVLVTGGSGFIGAWAVDRLLRQGHQVRIFDVKDDRRLMDAIGVPQDYQWITGDITNPKDVERVVEGCEAIIHLAGVLVPICREDPIRGAMINVLGTLHVFEAAKKHGVRGISYASSAAVFGPEDGKHPLPYTHYGAYKLCNEGTSRAYFAEHRIRSVGLRPLTVYGPGRDFGITAGPTFAMKAAATGEAYTIPFTGWTAMDWCEDTAEVFVRGALEAPEGAFVFSLGDVACTIDDIVREIKAAVPGAQVDAKGAASPIAAHLDQGDLDTVFAGRSKTSLAEGVRRTIDYYRKVGTSGR